MTIRKITMFRPPKMCRSPPKMLAKICRWTKTCAWSWLRSPGCRRHCRWITCRPRACAQERCEGGKKWMKHGKHAARHGQVWVYHRDLIGMTVYRFGSIMFYMYLYVLFLVVSQILSACDAHQEAESWVTRIETLIDGAPETRQTKTKQSLNCDGASCWLIFSWTLKVVGNMMMMMMMMMVMVPVPQ